MHVISSSSNNEQILPYLAKKLRRVKLVNKVLVAQFLFFRPWILISNIEEINLNRNSNSSFIRFRWWISPITGVVWSIEMPSFDYLKDVYIIFIQQKHCDMKTRTKKGALVEKRTNHFEQTLKLLKCEEGKDYPRDFYSRPSIWILRS